MTQNSPPLLSQPAEQWVRLIQDGGLGLLHQGMTVGHYFAAMDETAIATQRDTKDHLPSRLRASAESPQIVTVRGRSGEASQAYVIMPIERFAETLEAVTPDRSDFVPITAELRRMEVATGFAPEMLPLIERQPSRRRSRATVATVPAMDDMPALTG